jgi:HK97 gp10 family phage protein
MTIKNHKSFLKKLDKQLTDTKAKEYVTRGTMIVQNTAKKSILAGGTGRTYEKYEPRRTHTASAPNQPPASDTGFLANNITMEVNTESNGTVVGKIISSAPYSKFLEFGTTNITERPFMQPALQKNKQKILNLFRKGILK